MSYNLDMPYVYFLRHGQSQANADHITAGHLESPLTPLGRHQAAQAAQTIVAQRLHFDAILCSPLGRTRQTAAIITSAIGFPPQKVIYLDDLIERDCGDLENQPTELYVHASEAVSVRRWHVEPIVAMQKRALRIKAFVDHNYTDSDRVLIVSHSGFGKMLRIVFTGQKLGTYDKSEHLPNASLLTFSLSKK